MGFGALRRLSYMPSVTDSRPQHSAEVAAIVCEHQAALLRTARRHSLCADDAHDACQRGVEIFLRRAGRLRMDTAVSWLHTVVKHEAMAIRGARQRLVSGVEPALDRHEGRCVAGVEERVESRERVARGAAVLSELKPQERTALLLQAEGHSYRDISRHLGWTYTKVNRCLTEGRRSFLERYADVEAGGECARRAELVRRAAAGSATAEEHAALRPHLRACPACRAAAGRTARAGAPVAARP